MKAHKVQNNGISIFRLEDHHERFYQTCRRLSIPPIELPDFREALELLVKADSRHIGGEDERNALYLRPFIFATEESLSVKPSDEYIFSIVGSPVREYFGVKKQSDGEIDVMLCDKRYIRAAAGGTGRYKFSGNYPGTFPMKERGAKYNCSQTLWLDAKEHRYIEEMDTMNVFFLCRRSGREVLMTPSKDQNEILPGVTRESFIELCRVNSTMEIEETLIDYKMLLSGDYGELVEFFATGTAANLLRIGKLYSPHGEILWQSKETSHYSALLKDFWKSKLNQLPAFAKWHHIIYAKA
jgi:branched-chain amino acid aminotransferase